MNENLSTIPLCVPDLGGNAWSYVKDCLDTGWVSSVGSYVDRFERSLAEAAELPYAVATVSGTAALHTAMLVCGVEPDDEVLVSTLTFIAPVNAIRYAGAWPVFVDADPDHWEMDTVKLADFLNRRSVRRNGALYNRETGRRIRAILPVHILGHPVDMDAILELARKYDLKVIEDATESLGSSYRGHAVGSMGDVACFSFNGNKIITTGGGGMLVTRNQNLASKARYLTTQAKDNSIEYIHREIGYNYRLTNIQAALGVSQMEQLEAHVAAKKRIAARYNSGLKGVSGIGLPKEADWAGSCWWMYTVLVEEESYGMSSRELLEALGDQRIQTRPLWQPCHLSPAHQPAVLAGSCETAERLYATAITLPCSVGLTFEEQDRVIEAVSTAAAASAGKSRMAAAAV